MYARRHSRKSTDSSASLFWGIFPEVCFSSRFFKLLISTEYFYWKIGIYINIIEIRVEEEGMKKIFYYFIYLFILCINLYSYTFVAEFKSEDEKLLYESYVVIDFPGQVSKTYKVPLEAGRVKVDLSEVIKSIYSIRLRVVTPDSKMCLLIDIKENELKEMNFKFDLREYEAEGLREFVFYFSGDGTIQLDGHDSYPIVLIPTDEELDLKYVENPLSFSLASGVYEGMQYLEMNSAPGCSIYYTTDGSDPLVAGHLFCYEKPILISENTVVKAFVRYENDTHSNVVTQKYTIKIPAVRFSLKPGTYDTFQSLTLSSPFKGAVIIYTTNGQDPKPGVGKTYKEPINLSTNATITIKAMAYKANCESSIVTTKEYTIAAKVKDPMTSLIPGGYRGAIQVGLASPTQGAVVHYTLDGSTPGPNTPTIYNGLISLTNSCMIKMIATKQGYEPSNVVTAVFYIYGWQSVGERRFTPAVSSCRHDKFLKISNGKFYLLHFPGGSNSNASVYINEGSGWNVLGTQGIIKSNSYFPAMDVLNNKCFVAFADREKGGKLSLIHYNGTSWSFIDQAFSNYPVEQHIALCVIQGVNTEVSYVAYEESSKLIVLQKRINGANVVSGEYIPQHPKYGNAYNLSIYIGQYNRYLAFTEYTHNKAMVRYLQGSYWDVLASPTLGVQTGFSQGEAQYLSFYVDPAAPNLPYAAFCDVANGSRATVMKVIKNSSNQYVWVPIGPPGFTSGPVKFTSFCLHQGVPHLSYIDVNNGNRVKVLKYNGKNWFDVGDQYLSAGEAIGTCLVSYGGSLYVAFYEKSPEEGLYKATVMKWQ
jgi:hypothetical protein